MYRKKSGDKSAVPHSHSYYQIIWFFEDGGTHDVDFKCFDIQKNTLLFISKDQVHAFDDNLEIKGWLIHFNESFFMHSDVDIFLKYNLFNSPQNPCYSIGNELVEVGFSYISLIQKELTKRESFGSEDVIRFLLKSFLINLERVHRKSVDQRIELTSQYEFQFYKFKDLLEENYAKNLSVQSYAEQLFVSSKTLSTITISMVSKLPSLLISERVILEAKRLLRFTTLQISEIAFRLGFDDASYFVKYFKRHMDISPSAYRSATTN
jgi:AraC-like DNA-binding protein